MKFNVGDSKLLLTHTSFGSNKATARDILHILSVALQTFIREENALNKSCREK
jgi:hypothetical protein